MTRPKFLGASVRYYNSTIGWGDTPSELVVGLAEDSLDGDVFSPPTPGSPVYFEHNNFTFNGILQHYELSRSEGGAPVYEVSVYDPRIILDGVQLILDSYYGSVYSTNNLINVYGFLENTYGFGYSEADDSGIPWMKITSALTSIMNGANTLYGKSVIYNGYSYSVYLTPLPSLPSYYRVGGGSISLLGFIQEICDAANLDWFCTLVGNNIIIQTVNRNYQPSNYTAIMNYAGTVQANSTKAGIELADNVTSKFLLGGPVDRLFYNFDQTYQNDTQTSGAEDNTIWPFWGFTGEYTYGKGNVIVGQGYGNNHKFSINAKSWSVYGIGEWYHTDVAEMRAALDSQESWEAFLWLRNDNPNYPQYFRAETVGIVGDINQSLGALLGQGDIDLFNKLTSIKFHNMRAQPVIWGTDFNHQHNIKILYDYVRGIAEDYYGKKWMVRIPFVYSALQESSNKIDFSQFPVDSAYVDEDNWASAIGNGLLPYDINKFTNEENKFVAFVRFDNCENLDFSDISDDDKHVTNINNQKSVFVKCEVDPNIVFLESSTFYSPRVVVTLPGVVREKSLEDVDENFYCSIIYDAIYQNLINLGQNSVDAKKKTKGILNQFGKDAIAMGQNPPAIRPSMAAVPLRSKLLSYGPWYSVSSTVGRVEFEVDENLVPWNFNGFTLMNQIGTAKVQEVYSNQLINETGSIVFPGAPEHSLGAQLAGSGPYVTDISCSISETGMLTTYNMKVSTPNFGKLRKYRTERLTKLAKTAQEFRRKVRGLIFKRGTQQKITNIKTKYFKSIKAKRDKSNSSHFMLCGEIVGNKNIGYAYNVVTQPTYNTIGQLNVNYTNKGGMSLDGLFRPFSTNPENSGMPHFENHTGSGTGPNVDNLNPFNDNHDIQAIIHGQEVPEDVVISNLDSYPSITEYRPIALKAPLILTGWGYDTEENPIPNASGNFGTSTNRIDNYQQRSDLWKTGPLDVRWDNDRKVWTGGGGDGQTKIVRVLNDGIEAPDSPLVTYKKVYKCVVVSPHFDNEENADVTLTETEQEIYAGNFRDTVIITDLYYLVHNINGKWIIDSQSAFESS